MLERLQKILSARGIASRRKAEELIEQGLVLVNGKPAKVGDKADPDNDAIEVSGEVLEARKDLLYYLFFKPAGVVTSNVDRREDEAPAASDGPSQGFEVTKSALERLKKKRSARRPEANATIVRDLLPAPLQGKVFPVGRLDKDSEGLLLLTNDGVLAYRLTHPKFEHEKEYAVETDVTMTAGMLKKLADGVKIDQKPTKPAKIEKTGDKSFRIALTEGRYRQIRRMCSKVGATVTSLKRIRIVNVVDETLEPGEVRPLEQEERDALLRSVGLS
jgi:pseudouridine synthase